MSRNSTTLISGLSGCEVQPLVRHGCQEGWVECSGAKWTVERRIQGRMIHMRFSSKEQKNAMCSLRGFAASKSAAHTAQHVVQSRAMTMYKVLTGCR